MFKVNITNEVGMTIEAGKITAAKVERNDNHAYSVLVTINDVDYWLIDTERYSEAWEISSAIMVLSKVERGVE